MALAVLVAGVAGMLAPPLSAATLGSVKHATRAGVAHRQDPVIGFVMRWLYVDEECYGGDGPQSPWYTPGTYPNPDMIEAFLIRGTLYEDGTYTETSEDDVGHYSYQCEGDIDADFTPEGMYWLFGDQYCPLLEPAVEQP